MIRDKDFAVLRNILKARWARLAHPNITIGLSGGADSATVLFSALDAGLRPRCFTFHLEGYESADLCVARQMCAAFGLEHQIVVVPNDPLVVRRDAQRALLGCANSCIEKPRKIFVQVLHPWFHVAEVVGTDSRIVVGIEADSLFLTTRHDQELVREKGDEFVSKYRRSVGKDPRFSSYHIHYLCRGQLGLDTHDLFFSSEVAAWFQRFRHTELHTPFVKWGFVGAYKDYWAKGNWRRDPSSYQVNSGIRDMHAKAFGCDDKGTIAHYNRLASQLGIAYGSDMAKFKYSDEDPIRLLNADGTVACDPTERDRAVALGKLDATGADPA